MASSDKPRQMMQVPWVPNPRTKMTASKAREMRRLHSDEGWTNDALKDKFQVHASTVSDIIRGKTWVEATGGKNLSRRPAQLKILAARQEILRSEIRDKRRPFREVADELGLSVRRCYDMVKYMKSKGQW